MRSGSSSVLTKFRNVWRLDEVSKDRLFRHSVIGSFWLKIEVVGSSMTFTLNSFASTFTVAVFPAPAGPFNNRNGEKFCPEMGDLGKWLVNQLRISESFLPEMARSLLDFGSKSLMLI